MAKVEYKGLQRQSCLTKKLALAKGLVSVAAGLESFLLRNEFKRAGLGLTG